jgi:hypothetical protein
MRFIMNIFEEHLVSVLLGRVDELRGASKKERTSMAQDIRAGAKTAEPRDAPSYDVAQSRLTALGAGGDKPGPARRTARREAQTAAVKAGTQPSEKAHKADIASRVAMIARERWPRDESGKVTDTRGSGRTKAQIKAARKKETHGTSKPSRPGFRGRRTFHGTKGA